MKVPISWLNEYVDIDVSPEELARLLTFSGTEVEGIEAVGRLPKEIIVGEIVDMRNHADADNLRVCRVNDGQDTFDVVCGADNFEIGDKGAFAPVGTTLAHGLMISKRQIRGESSEGMLCAEDELELSDDHSGILLVDRDVAAGTPLQNILPDPEVVLQVEVTWNRSDCLSIIGIAREIAALLGKPLSLPDVDYDESGKAVGDLVSVTIDRPDYCARYTARLLTHIKDGQSPRWMQRRLSICGVRPISTIVDITNYVMLECGQPLHAFDYDQVVDKAITVRCAENGETITTLDGTKRTLDSETLLITDGEGPVALAGVMGGEGSGVSDKTSRVLLESANFAAAGIHRTSTMLGLSSESSHRFERGVDQTLADWGSRRAIALLIEHGGGVASAGVVDIFPGETALAKVTCRFGRIRSLLGVDVKDEDIVRMLESVGLELVSRDATSCEVCVPLYRKDIEREADLIEEVARLHGLDAIPESTPPSASGGDRDDVRPRAIELCRTSLVSLGMSEIMNYSFLAEKTLEQCGCHDSQEILVLPNPVSADQGVMRNSLIPQMFESLGRNRTRQLARAFFFEIGTIFHQDQNGLSAEEQRLVIGLMGAVGTTQSGSRHGLSEEAMFLQTKGVVEATCANLKAGKCKLRPVTSGMLTEGWSMQIMLDDRSVGILGLAKPEIVGQWRITDPLGVAELELDSLLRNVFRTPVFEPIPVYPSVSRDLAIIVPENVRHEQVVGLIRKVGPSELTDIELFDIFRDIGIGEDMKSLAYALVYRSSERTLTDEDVNAFDETIMEALRSELKAEIREQ